MGVGDQRATGEWLAIPENLHAGGRLEPHLATPAVPHPDDLGRAARGKDQRLVGP